ncbi:hypothetical protein [Sphingobacterium sp.]
MSLLAGVTSLWMFDFGQFSFAIEHSSPSAIGSLPATQQARQ